MRSNTPAWIGIAILVIAAVILVLNHNNSLPGDISHDSFARLVMGVALLLVIGGGVLSAYAGNTSLLLKQAATWIGIGLALVAVYAFRPELMTIAERTMGALMPGRPMELSRSGPSSSTGPGIIAIAADRSGQFSADAMVNGTHVRFLVDTGASAVILTPNDALRAGINMKQLIYSVTVRTANGTNQAAAARIDEIRIGSIEVRDVRALVAKPDLLSTSLLGMTFLSKLRSFKISGGQLVLER
ncbi:MAG: TIGR02281 family clan AA aspartic protease [Hyphomicrobiales bacterium]|nr:MAG: TIGR02281 family clan AA aspartic protease [Hyphomicrobiales bacterium]